MKKITLIVAILSLSWAAIAQQDGSTLEQPVRPPAETPWEREDIGVFSDPISYVHQREADVVYSFTIWRRIDLREKMNHPLYFPRETRGSWRSLAQVIFDAIDMENPDNTNALPIYSDEFCQQPVPRDQISENMYTTIQIDDVDLETGEPTGLTVDLKDYFTAANIYAYDIKEVWFFDKRRSLQEVRIIQINPIIEYEKPASPDQYEDQGFDMNEEDYVEVPRQKRQFGYIYYNELRPYLAKQDVYNVKNFSQRISLDDLLTWKRMFTSYIIAESNEYSDRYISEYITNARDQMIESEAITNKIRVREHDLWEF